jgi:hypothetical protein
MLPSDTGYTPACTDPKVIELPIYRALLQSNTDPYAPHSRDEGLISIIEEFSRADHPA